MAEVLAWEMFECELCGELGDHPWGMTGRYCSDTKACCERYARQTTMATCGPEGVDANGSPVDHHRSR